MERIETNLVTVHPDRRSSRRENYRENSREEKAKPNSPLLLFSGLSALSLRLISFLYDERFLNWIRSKLALLAYPMGIPGPHRHIRVSYGYGLSHVWRRHIAGGHVKFAALNRIYPHYPCRFNILYLGSSTLPLNWPDILETAIKRRIKIVWNQNGVGYPAWSGRDSEARNAPMRAVLMHADHVFYQSRFCKISSDRFLVPPKSPWEILHNPVDTRIFRPATGDQSTSDIILLHAGTIGQLYRFETALWTVSELLTRRVKTKLIVAGDLAWHKDRKQASQQAKALVANLGLEAKVTLLPRYTRSEAPSIFKRAHILLHTTVNDTCPTVVLEAMACGLPVVYSKSGGVPELVGETAGIGVPDSADWERFVPGCPTDFADAVIEVASRKDEFSEEARRRVVEYFDMELWLQRHHTVFQHLTK